MSLLNVRDVSLIARRRYYLIANAIIGGWIVAGVVITVLRQIGFDLSWWLSVHSITIGVIASAILVYTHHFAEALTRTASQSYGGRLWRLGLLQLCLIGLIVGNTGIEWGITATISALGIIGVLLAHLVILMMKLRRSLAGTFVVTVNYYVLAGLHLITAIVLVILASYDIGDYGKLIIVHSRLAVWGFAVLTVLGTVVTLLPTVARDSINATARNRMARALVVYCCGLYLMTAAIVLTWTWGAAIGAAIIIVAIVLITQPILATVLGQGNKLSVAAWGIIGGLLWLMGLIALDTYSFAINHDGRDLMLVIVLPLVFGGLVQLITSVLSHLLPVLIGGGAVVTQTQAVIMRTGFARLIVVNLGGVLLLFDQDFYGLLLVVPATMWTLGVLAISTVRQRKLVMEGKML